MSPFMGDAEFKEEWFGEDEEGNSLHEIGMRGAWDAAKRDEELDNDGVTGEVMFPGPDAATGTMGAPFGAGFNPVATDGPRAPARGRACVQPLGGRDLPGEPRATRRPDRGPDPRRPRRRHRRDPARPRRRAYAAASSSRRSGATTRRTRATATTPCGRWRRSSTCPCTATPAPARTRTTAKCRAG